MTFHGEPQNERYDVVVVGSGIAGVTSASLLAKAGRKVLLVEQRDSPGGYAHAFHRGPYTLDPAVHMSCQGRDGQLFDGLLRYLEVRDLCTFVPVDPFYGASFPGLSLKAPADIEGYIEIHGRLYPTQADAYRKFVELCRQLHRDTHDLPMQLSLQELDQAVERFPVLFKYIRATVADVFEELFSDPHARAVAGAPWPYLGLPPSKLSFLTFAGMLLSNINSVFYCKGGFQKLVDALVVSLQQHEGEIVFGNGVSRITIQNGSVTGIELDNGRQVQCQIVISNADARQTFLELVGDEHLPKQFVQRLRRLKASLSGFVLFAATTLDMHQFDIAHETFVSKHWDHDQSYADIRAGLPGGVWITIPTLVDPSLVPSGEHLLIFSSLAEYGTEAEWAEKRQHFTELLLDAGENLFPGLRNNLTFLESATPAAFQRYTRNYNGAAYGWDYTPEQTGARRLNHDTPIQGLYLAGHWTQPGAASMRVLSSGIHTAQIVLARHDRGDHAPTFQHPDLPAVV